MGTLSLVCKLQTASPSAIAVQLCKKAVLRRQADRSPNGSTAAQDHDRSSSSSYCSSIPAHSYCSPCMGLHMWWLHVTCTNHKLLWIYFTESTQPLTQHACLPVHVLGCMSPPAGPVRTSRLTSGPGALGCGSLWC